MNRFPAIAVRPCRALRRWSAMPALAQNFPDHPDQDRSCPIRPADRPTRWRAWRRRVSAPSSATAWSLKTSPAPAAGLATKDVARAAPDGYTLLLGGSNEYAITPALYKNLDYDPVKDLVAGSGAGDRFHAIVVNPSVPVHSLNGTGALRQGASGQAHFRRDGRHRAASCA